ncbi:MAG TPA: hypothetical protein VFH09_01405 [Nitrososphaera sp.]|nr:hypothetical protein [Nitrososphaera sp.]
MSSKLLIFVLIALAIVFGTLNVMNSAFAQTAEWYPGEGIRQDMYVKYRIEDYDTNERQPFVLTLYFQEQQQDGNWIVPVYVEAGGGRVFQGTLKLSETMSPLAGGEIPPEMNEFIGGYQNSLIWLDSFTTKAAPQSLTSGSWGKIASIGGQEVKPVGTEQVSFAGAQSLCGASSCDSTLVSWRKGVDSKVWVVNEVPFPVKAEAYADVTTPPQPIQYRFELLETGTGQPVAPTGTGEASGPPLERTTNDGSHIILTWDPVDIQANSNVSFGLELRDAQSFPLQDAAYDFTVKDANGQILQEFRDQRAELGTASHQVTFNSTGPKTVTVTINAVAGQPTGQIIQTTDFNVVVVPEFAVSTAILAAAAVISLLVFMTRARRTNPGSVLFGPAGAP